MPISKQTILTRGNELMALSDRVHIARRFQRSIRIDSDLNTSESLEGFICT